MPGFMRRTMSYLGLVEEYDDDYESRRDRATMDRGRTPVTAERPVSRDRELDRDRERERERDRERERERDRVSLAPVAERHSAPQPAVPEPADLSRITTVHPRTYSDARTIGEQFRGGTPVIMNLSEMSDADAKRLVDFAAGLIFGLRGSIDRVTSKVFLLSPPNVTVTAEDKARIVESGAYNVGVQ